MRRGIATAVLAVALVAAPLACATEDGRVVTVPAAEQREALDRVTGTWATTDGSVTVTLCPHANDPTDSQGLCTFDSSLNEDVECFRSSACRDTGGCGSSGSCIAFSVSTNVGVVIERDAETLNLVGHLDFGTNGTELFSTDITRYHISTNEVILSFALGAMSVQTGQDYVHGLERVDAGACN